MSTATPRRLPGYSKSTGATLRANDSAKGSECRRGGDCEGTMPSMSAEHLQRDLDFYQLPSLDELGLPVVCRDVSSSRISADSASKKLMQEVVGEIIESGLEDTFPWCVYIYYRFSTATLAPRRRILVIPDAVRTTFLDPNLSFVKDRRHDAFVQAVHGKTFSVSPSTKDVAVRSPDTKTQFALQIPSEDLRKLVGTVAQSSGFYMDFKQRVNSPAANQPFSELPYIHLYPR